MAKRILLIDDSQLVRHLVRGYLEAHAGFVVCGEASDGQEAVESARKLVPDLIVIDLCMPRMNGLEASTILRSLLPNVPIILFTLHEDILSAKQIEAAGINAVVSKTGEMEILLEQAYLLTDPGGLGTSPPAN